MQKKELEKILNQIAKQHNTTAEEVYQEMQFAIDAAQVNPSPDARAKWDAIPKKNDTPSVEEFLDFMIHTLNNLGY